MTTWYVQQGASGTNSGTLSNPWNAWSSIVWASVAAGDVVKIIGTLTPNDFSGIGAHGGVEGAEVIITSYSDLSSIAPLGAGSLRLNRSHTILYDIPVAGELMFQSTDTNVATLGTNIQIDSLDVSGTGIKIDYPSGTGASNVNRKYSGLRINNVNIHDAKRGLFTLPGASGATAIMQIDGLEIKDFTSSDLQDSVFELRMESTLNKASYFNNLTFDNVRTDRIGKGSGGGCVFRLWAATGNDPMSNGLIINNIQSDDVGNSAVNGVGGNFILGFGKSAGDYSQNTIKNVSITNSVGAAGALNILRCNYIDVDGLYGANISTNTIDGNGLLIDLYNRNIRAKNIVLNDIIGKSGVNNSGCAVMILENSSDIDISGVKATGCRHGIYYGNGYTSNIIVHDNEFKGCTVTGIYGDLGHNNGNRVYNNKFEGSGSASSVISTQPTTIAHDYNTFNAFGTGSTNYTLSANEKINTEQVNKIAGY